MGSVMLSLTSRTRVIVQALVAVLLCCGIAALAEAAQATALALRVSRAVRLSVWSPSGDIADYAHVGVAGNGSAVVAWSQTVGTGNHWAIMVASRSRPAGRWTTPGLISDASVSALYPALAVAPSGAAVVVWEANGPSYSYIEASNRRSMHGPWSAPHPLSTVGQNAAQPVIGIDAHGDATAVWIASGPLEGNEIQTAGLTLRTGRWSPAVTLAASPSSFLVTPQVAVNDRGDAVVVWRKPSSGSVLAPSGVRSRVYAASRAARASRFSSPVVVGTELDLPFQGLSSFELPGPQVVIDATGRAMAVWQSGPDPAHVISQVVVEGAPGTAWRAGRSLSRTVAIWPHLATDSQGQATVVWETLGSHGLTDVDSSTGSITGCCWSAPTATATGSDYVVYPRVSVNSLGDAVASWCRGGMSPQLEQRVGANGAWSRPVNVGGQNAGVSELAFVHPGDALVVWSQPGVSHNGRVDTYLAVADTQLR